MEFNQEDPAAKAPHNILAQIAGDFFRAVIPKIDLAFAIDHAHARLQTFQRGPKDFRVLKVQHLQSSLFSYRRKRIQP